METWHNHASCIVQAPNGDLLVCWFHGSGERTADDVKIEGARLRRGTRQWSPRFTMADTPGFPDGNPCMFIDPRGRLWLIYTTILANTWESALLKVRVSHDYLRRALHAGNPVKSFTSSPGRSSRPRSDVRLPAIETAASSSRPQRAKSVWRRRASWAPCAATPMKSSTSGSVG